jgi:hypothetical protein
MAKTAAKKKFALTQAVWVNGSEQLPIGTAVTFDNDEPTGIFIGRVEELTDAGAAIDVSTPAEEKSDATLAKEAEAVPTPPAPPAA